MKKGIVFNKNLQLMVSTVSTTGTTRIVLIIESVISCFIFTEPICKDLESKLAVSVVLFFDT